MFDILYVYSQKPKITLPVKDEIKKKVTMKSKRKSVFETGVFLEDMKYLQVSDIIKNHDNICPFFRI